MKGYKKKRKSVVTTTKSVTTVSAPSRPLEIHMPNKPSDKPVIIDGNKYVAAFSTSTAYVPGTVLKGFYEQPYNSEMEDIKQYYDLNRL